MQTFRITVDSFQLMKKNKDNDLHDNMHEKQKSKLL